MVQGKPYRTLLQRKSDRAAGCGTDRRWREKDNGAEEISEFQHFGQNRDAAAADARIFKVAADVAAARARSRDAPVPPVAAPSWPDRAAMAHFAGVDRSRHDRGHGTGAGRVPARPEPVAHSARPRGA